MISNEDLFWNSDAVIAFVVSKRVRRRSQFLILSPGWPCTQNNSCLNWHFHSFSWKTQLWANDIKHEHVIHYWKWFFTTIKNLRSLPENKTSFGTDQLLKFWQFASKSVFWNPTTFIANWRHHYDEGDELNLLVPRTVSVLAEERRIDDLSSRLGHAPHPSTMAAFHSELG